MFLVNMDYVVRPCLRKIKEELTDVYQIYWVQGRQKATGCTRVWCFPGGLLHIG